MKVTFITGNQNKVNFLNKYLGFDVDHKKLDLDEIQSLDLHEIAEHKVKQAYNAIKSPVLVEDVALSLDALGRLPGPYIKFFEIELGLQGFCDFVARLETNVARVTVTYAYYDGEDLRYFDDTIIGVIADKPRGDDPFGFNPVFIPDGQPKTLGEMNEEQTKQYSLRTRKIYPELLDFFKAKNDIR